MQRQTFCWSLVVPLTLAACGGSGAAGPGSGGLSVTVTTTGSAPDTDGYVVILNDTLEQPVAPGGARWISTDHQIRSLAHPLDGVPLQAGERVIYFYKPSYTADKVVLWICGILMLIVLIGIIFIILALIHDGRNPKAQVVTNMRVMEISGKGVPTWMALQEAVDLEPERQKVQGGGGLVGALVSAAATAIADSMANKKSKMDPKYWTRGIAVNIQNRNGQKFRIQTRQPLVLGPFLARCILEPGAAQMAPQVPADP